MNSHGLANVQTFISAGQQFKCGTRNHRSPDFAILNTVSVDCGFFSDPVYDTMHTGSLAVSEGVPSVSCLRSSFLVFYFLQFCPGTNIPPFLPPDR